MAKGLRSSVKQRNKSILRKEVFGPVVDRRTERLSAKLQELASTSLVKDANMLDADSNVVEKAENHEVGAEDTAKAMDIDENPNSVKPKPENVQTSTDRVQKRARNRKTRPSITFAAHPAKGKRVSRKK